MKTLSRTLAFILLAIVAIVTFMSCATTFGIYQYVRVIGNPLAIPPVYREFKKGGDNDSDFRAALIALKQGGGVCEITILHPGPHQTPIPGYCEHLGPVKLKTDRVIKSKTASNAATVGQPAANDPNVTWKIASNNLEDIQKVMDTLAP
jgi:hypothetical protein